MASIMRSLVRILGGCMYLQKRGKGYFADVIFDCPPKMTKYEKLTALSKTLRDDASCQLCSILLKYLVRNNGGHLADVEADLDPKGVPPLTTLRQVNYM